MGSWHETCAITRTPIRTGMPVVAINTVHGPKYKVADHTGLKTDLLFGVPFVGAYDDYGGVENLEAPALADLHGRAFEQAGFFKKHVLARRSGGAPTWWLAADPDALWSLPENIKHLYYPELGLRLSEVNSTGGEAREKSLAAYRKATAALKTLGTKLGQATFGPELAVAEDQLFKIFEEVFGPQAWAAWAAIKHEGLFASRGQLLMHQTAYQTIVREFGSRTVGFYREHKRYKLRDHLASLLDGWLAAFPAEYDKALQLFGDSDTPTQAQQRTALRLAGTKRSFAVLNPLSTLWMGPEMPLIGHFWGGATVEDILAVVDREALLDYFVFQWARSYMRIDLTRAGGGSQNEEVVLTEKVVKATFKVLKEHNMLKKDFDGTLFR